MFCKNPSYESKHNATYTALHSCTRVLCECVCCVCTFTVPVPLHVCVLVKVKFVTYYYYWLARLRCDKQPGQRKGSNTPHVFALLYDELFYI